MSLFGAGLWAEVGCLLAELEVLGSSLSNMERKKSPLVASTLHVTATVGCGAMNINITHCGHSRFIPILILRLTHSTNEQSRTEEPTAVHPWSSARK